MSELDKEFEAMATDPEFQRMTQQGEQDIAAERTTMLRLRHPYCCPICGGKGIVPAGFYTSTELTWSSTSTVPEPCRACVGTGLVWG